MDYSNLVDKFCQQYRGTLTRNNRLWFVLEDGAWVKDSAFRKAKRIMSSFLTRNGFTAYRYLARFQTDVAQVLKYSVNI